MRTDNGMKVIETFESQLALHETPDLPESALLRSSAWSVMTIFLWINGAVFLFVVVAFIIDCVLVIGGIMPSSDRVIDAKVVISLVGAATIQVGAIAFSPSLRLLSRDETRSTRRGREQDSDPV